MINWRKKRKIPGKAKKKKKKEYQTNLALILANLFLNSFIVYDKGKGVYLWKKNLIIWYF